MMKICPNSYLLQELSSEDREFQVCRCHPAHSYARYIFLGLRTKERVKGSQDQGSKRKEKVEVKGSPSGLLVHHHGSEIMSWISTNWYLGTPLEKPEWMQIPIRLLSKQIIEWYNLEPLIHKGFVYVCIEKGMYGLPQAGRIAYECLKKELQPFGYTPCKFTHGLWKHNKSNMMFTLVVDDFGIHYTDKADVENLLSALRKTSYPKFSIDWEGKQYIGLTIEWDYEARTVTLSMPGYVEQHLTAWAHPFTDAPKEDAPHAWRKPAYALQECPFFANQQR